MLEPDNYGEGAEYIATPGGVPTEAPIERRTKEGLVRTLRTALQAEGGEDYRAEISGTWAITRTKARKTSVSVTIPTSLPFSTTGMPPIW